jgi:peptidoglycan/LPS O-acetylase OafA/YrhL
MQWLAQRLELGRSGSTPNLLAMEGLRGLAVFLVFLVHCMTLTMPWWADHAGLSALASELHALGNVGVDLFFVLSGFLIYGALINKAQPFGRYFGRRVRRIYPVFLVMLALYLALSVLFPSESKLPAGAGAAALYVLQNLLLLPGMLPIAPIITVAWSLSYEFFFYLVVPVLIAALGLRGRTPAFRIWALVVLGLAGAAYLAVQGGHVRLLMFLAGMLVYELHHERVRLPGAGALGALGLCLGLGLALLPLGGLLSQTLKYLGLGLVFGLLCLDAFAPTWLSRALSWTPLRWLGNISYSYYLMHGLALKFAVLVLGKVLPLSAGGVGLFLVLPGLLFVATLPACLILFLAVERPFSLAPKAA